MKEILKEMLKNLIPCIEGKWFVGDGALLGIIRNGDLLDFDDDVDIFILPVTKINWNYTMIEMEGLHKYPIGYILINIFGYCLNIVDLIVLSCYMWHQKHIKKKK